MKIDLDKKTLYSIQAVVLYLAPDEGKHYEENGKPKDHIFRHVMRLARFVDKTLER